MRQLPQSDFHLRRTMLFEELVAIPKNSRRHYRQRFMSPLAIKLVMRWYEQKAGAGDRIRTGVSDLEGRHPTVG